MSGIAFEWLADFLAELEAGRVRFRQDEGQDLPPAKCIVIEPIDWGRAARQAATFGCRWAGVWGDHRAEEIVINCMLEHQGDYLLLRASITDKAPQLSSQTPYYPAADRMERRLHDLLGVVFIDHPDKRRWIRHQAWGEGEFPLRNDYPLAGEPQADTPPDGDYPFQRIEGSGVYEIPVGPVHAGIIEPGHFRFQAVGEDVLRLEQHLGYVHKGIEKLAVGRDTDGLARLAGRVSGDSTVAHTWAACQAMERAAGIEIPRRALVYRAILAERERIANHLGDIGGICNDVGFAFAQYQFTRLREDWLRHNRQMFGHRLLMDCVVPGGVCVELHDEDIDLMQGAHPQLRKELQGLYAVLNDHSSLEDRLLTAGFLGQETAARLGVLGYIGKASGQEFDVRRDNPYAPYDVFSASVPVLTQGDVAARMQVRMWEILASMDLIDTMLEALPDTPLRTAWQTSPEGAEGLGMIEGWRGEIICHVRFGADGRIARFFPRDPSWFAWPALEQIVLNNIVPDFPVCNKSVNGSYSGHDL